MRAGGLPLKGITLTQTSRSPLSKAPSNLAIQMIKRGVRQNVTSSVYEVLSVQR